jgi:hypothetical protein
MPFNVNACNIKTFYCGNGDVLDRNIYSRKGTTYECMQKGFGAGSWAERKKHLPAKSLQHIKYVGETFEAKFKQRRIKDTDALVRKLSPMTAAQKKAFLEDIFKRGNGTTEYRGYNNVLLFLNAAGISRLPRCRDS